MTERVVAFYPEPLYAMQWTDHSDQPPNHRVRPCALEGECPQCLQRMGKHGALIARSASNPKAEIILIACPGDWIVWHDEDVFVLTDEVIRGLFAFESSSTEF